MTRKELYTAIIAAGVALHPCNASDTAPADDTSIYYLTTEELTSIYADTTDTDTDTDTDTFINGWHCVQVDAHSNGAFEYNGKWYFAKYHIEDHAGFLAYCDQLAIENY